MTRITPMPVDQWEPSCAPALQQSAVDELEQGNVLLFPQLGFSIEERERGLLSADTVGDSKNVSWDGAARQLRGSRVDEALQPVLRGMMQRFAAASGGLVRAVLAAYGDALIPSRTSFRAVEAAGRSTSWRKDDTRLHVDSFPSTPVQGKRILRVFSNVNPYGRPRSWRVGGAFEAVAQRFVPSLTAPVWGSDRLLQWCSITRGRRTPYDHYMLQLHDRMKADSAYQAGTDSLAYDFPPGTTWMVFTDQVPHAVLQGQYLLEQTFYLPVGAMRDPTKAPLRVLERLMGHSLA